MYSHFGWGKRKSPELGLEPRTFCSEDRCSTIEPSGLTIAMFSVQLCTQRQKNHSDKRITFQSVNTRTPVNTLTNTNDRGTFGRRFVSCIACVPGLLYLHPIVPHPDPPASDRNRRVSTTWRFGKRMWSGPSKLTVQLMVHPAQSSLPRR